MARSRLAAALVIPDPIATEIDGLRRAFGSPGRVRIPPHVTLIPPVNVPDDRMADALAVLERGAASTGPLRVALGPPATFWPPNPVVYLAVGPDGQAVRRLRDALNVAPIERHENRPFVPHVTIAERVEPPDRIPSALELLAAYRAEVTIEHVQLLRMDDERRWHVIAEVPLGGSRVVGRGGLEVMLTTSAVLDPEAASMLDGDEPFAVVARREGAVVGVATGTHSGDVVLERLVVDAAVRGQGIGRHLLAEVEAVASTTKLAICEKGAQAWFEGHGWVADMQLPGWRHGRDYVRMRKG